MKKVHSVAAKRERAHKTNLPRVAGAFVQKGAPPIRLRIRALWSAGGQHDVVYVSSFVHDAKLRLLDVYESGNWLVIPIHRLRQELPRQKDQKDEEATWVRSEIVLGPLKYWTVEFVGRFFIDAGAAPEEVVLHGLQSISGDFLAEGLNDELIVIDCNSVRLKVRLTDDAEIRLEDLPPKRRRKKVSHWTVRLAWPMGG